MNLLMPHPGATAQQREAEAESEVFDPIDPERLRCSLQRLGPQSHLLMLRQALSAYDAVRAKDHLLEPGARLYLELSFERVRSLLDALPEEQRDTPETQCVAEQVLFVIELAHNANHWRRQLELNDFQHTRARRALHHWLQRIKEGLARPSPHFS